MTPKDQEKFFTAGVRHGTLARCFWEVATDLEAQQGNHEEYVKAAFVRAIAVAIAEEREACAKIADAEEQYRAGNPVRANTGRDIAAAIRAQP